MNQQLKVAVIGASGIGKNHARWFHQHGCEVVAFVGSSPESVERTQKALEDGFGFAGRGYTDLDAMLSVELPQIVCISTPPPQHFAQALASLRAGAHVLCEKPLVYDPQKTTIDLLVQVIRLVEEAEIRGRLLGTQMQYGPALKHLLRAANVEADDVRDYEMLMETKNIQDKRDFEQIWIDLSPHALSGIASRHTARAIGGFTASTLPEMRSIITRARIVPATLAPWLQSRNQHYRRRPAPRPCRRWLPLSCG